jgi:hypothetical protein
MYGHCFGKALKGKQLCLAVGSVSSSTCSRYSDPLTGSTYATNTRDKQPTKSNTSFPTGGIAWEVLGTTLTCQDPFTG